jgi:hypothetical protein
LRYSSHILKISLCCFSIFFSTKPAEAQDNCFIIAASRQTLEAARTFASALDPSLPTEIRVATNGFFAVTVGLVDRSQANTQVRALISAGQIPPDAFCSSAGSYGDALPYSNADLGLLENITTSIAKKPIWMPALSLLVLVVFIWGVFQRKKKTKKTAGRHKISSSEQTSKLLYVADGTNDPVQSKIVDFGQINSKLIETTTKEISSPVLLNYPVIVAEAYVAESLHVEPKQKLFVLQDKNGVKYTVTAPLTGEIRKINFAYGMVVAAPSVLCELCVSDQNKSKAQHDGKSDSDRQPMNIGWVGVSLALIPSAYIAYWLVAIFLNGNVGNIYFDDFDIRSELAAWKWYHFVAFIPTFVILWLIGSGFISEFINSLKKVLTRKGRQEIAEKRSQALKKKATLTRAAQAGLGTDANLRDTKSVQRHANSGVKQTNTSPKASDIPTAIAFLVCFLVAAWFGVSMFNQLGGVLGAILSIVFAVLSFILLLIVYVVFASVFEGLWGWIIGTAKNGADATLRNKPEFTNVEKDHLSDPSFLKRCWHGLPIYFFTAVSLYVVIHATYASSLGTWHIFVASLALTFCILPVLLRYVRQMRKITAQKVKPSVGNWLLNFGLLIIFVSPSILLLTGGEGWWTLQDALPHRSESLVNLFAQLADFQPKPIVTAAQQLAFEDYLNAK